MYCSWTFDGPLFPDRYISYHHENRRPYPGRVAMPDIVNYWKMDPMSVEMLNFLHDLFPFETVVSSSWKKFIDKEQCVDLFHTNGLNLTLADDWATIIIPSYRDCVRASEIAEFVNRHSVDEYIILDDGSSGHSLTKDDVELDEKRIVLVNEDLGIGTHDYRTMLKIVKKWAGIAPPLW